MTQSLTEMFAAPVADAALRGLVAGYAVAVPVGALAVLLVGLTARTSFRVGAAGALGVATADGAYAALAVLGGAAVAGVVEPFAGPLRWLAAGVLTLMAARSGRAALRSLRTLRTAPTFSAARTPEASDRVVLGTPPRAYLGMLGLTLLNPWAVLYFSALTLGHRDIGGADAMSRTVFVAAIVAASLSWQLLLASGGSALGRTLTGVRGRAVTGLVSSAVIGGLAVALVVWG